MQNPEGKAKPNIVAWGRRCLVALVLLLVSCQATPTIDENNRETWELRLFYGELRFLIMEESADTPIPDATLRVSDLLTRELENEVGTEIELPFYEFTIRLAPTD